MSHKLNVAVFGLGNMFETFFRIYDSQKMEVLYLCDNNKVLWNQTIHGVKVISPEELAQKSLDRIFVTGKYAEEIRSQLEQYKVVGGGIERSSIVTIKEEKDLFKKDVKEFVAFDEYLFHVELEKHRKELQILRKEQEKNLFLNAKIYISNICKMKIDSLDEVEFKVFSQFGEDGIIQWIIHNVRIDNKMFVEFGVEDYSESNTRFLMMNDNWSGLVIDGDAKNIERVMNSDYYWRHDLTAIAEFITKDNINEVIRQAGITGDIGLLSVDLDGNDYWVLDSIECINPRIVICEYNSVFGCDKAVTVPYDSSFVRQEKHYSYLYWGVSLKALCLWAERNGYYFIGSNSAGNNAFFVKKDFIDKDILPRRAEYVESKYRESRDAEGKMSYLRGMERLKEIEEMEVINLEDNNCVRIKDLYHL